jgi:hypothetical protein
MSGQLHALAVLHPRKSAPTVPTEYRLGGTQSQSGRFGEETISFPYRKSNHDSSEVHPVV